jgi:hypothetical protein
MNPSRQQILHEMGLGPVWKLRAPSTAATATELRAEATHLVAERAPTGDTAVTRVASIAMPKDWDELAATVAACRQCRLCEVRKPSRARALATAEPTGFLSVKGRARKRMNAASHLSVRRASCWIICWLRLVCSADGMFILPMPLCVVHRKIELPTPTSLQPADLILHNKLP